MASGTESEKRETVAEMLAMVRRAAQYYDGEAEKSEGLLRETFKLSADNYRAIADRIEAAWKREREELERYAASKMLDGVTIVDNRGNAAAMRETLVDVYNTLDKLRPYSLHINDISVRRAFSSRLCHAKHDIDTALAKPPRNYEVGTAEEQYRRHDKFCDAARNGMSGYHCEDAPRCVFCFAKWAQMPYEEGGDSSGN